MCKTGKLYGIRRPSGPRVVSIATGTPNHAEQIAVRLTNAVRKSSWRMGTGMCLPILPDNPRQLPMFLNRSSLDGGGMRGADCQLEKLTEFSGNDSTMVVECSHDEWVMTN